MFLGVQTHFSQGWDVALMNQLSRFGTNAVRDSIAWGQIEKAPGHYDFASVRSGWLGQALERDIDVTLVFNGNGNPLYDGGYSVYTDAGRQAYANYIVATLKEFPDIAAIEIGNEYLSNNFVTGPIAQRSLSQRDEAYAELIAAVHQAISDADISVKIIGGAAHSIPVDWFKDLQAHGALEHMDAIAIHPYTTAPEQFEDQIAILRLAMGDRQLPIEVTEFGGDFDSSEDASAYLAKMVSVMASADIARASWYALAKQKWFPNMELFDQTTWQETAAGKTFALLDMLLSRGEVSRVAVDDFTYFYSFGDSAAVVWGKPRGLTLGSDVTVYDLAGNKVSDFSGKIGPNTPLILISANPLELGGNVGFEASGVVGDSFHQFDVSNPVPGSTAGFEGPWSYFALAGDGRLTALQTMGGGLRNGEAWTPYLGLTWLRPFQISAESLAPADFGNGADPAANYRTLERFTSDRDQTVTIRGRWDVADHSTDGILLTIRKNQTVLFEQVIYDPANGHVFELELKGIVLEQGDRLDFIVGVNGNPVGDRTERRITILDEALELPAPPPEPEAEAPPPPPVELNVVPVLGGKTLGTGKADIIDGSGRSGNQTLYGYSGDDVIIGGKGSDVIDGGLGADRMIGGWGNDRYTVDNVNDVVIELPGQGTDTISASVSYTLPDNVENLTLIGKAAIDGSGNALANVIIGNDADNVLYGGAGDDMLSGGGGDDFLIGGPGRDAMRGGPGADIFGLDVLESDANRTTIKDFEPGIDRIAIFRSAFAAFQDQPEGALDPASFTLGRAATSAEHRLIYDLGSGSLYYDPDGPGGQGQVHIALLQGNPVLDAGSFILI